MSFWEDEARSGQESARYWKDKYYALYYEVYPRENIKNYVHKACPKCGHLMKIYREDAEHTSCDNCGREL